MNLHPAPADQRMERERPGPGIGDVCEGLGRILRTGVDIHRCLAAQALGRIGHPGAVTPLIDALLDEDEDVRTDAATALAGVADPRAGKQLLENLLGDPCPEVKLAAIEALVRLGDPAVIPWLRRLVKGRDEEVAWDEEALFQDGWDDWADIQIKAVEGLAALGVEVAVSDIVEALADEHGQDLSEIAFKALARLGKPGIQALAGYLDDDDERRRRRAAAAIAGTDHAAAAEPTARALNDPAPDVRLAAARPLAARKPTDPRLAALLEDRDPAVRRELVTLIGGHHPDRLNALIDDGEPTVAEAVLGLLTVTPELGESAGVRESVRRKLDSPRPETASAAAMALAALDPDGAFDSLAAALADPDRPRDARLGVVRALRAIGTDPAADALAAVIGDDVRVIRLEVIAALAAIAHADGRWPNRAGGALLLALGGALVPAAPDLAADTATETATETDAPDADEEAQPDDAFPTSTLHSILEGDPRTAEVADLPDQGVELTPHDMERLALAARTPRRRTVPVMAQVAAHEDVPRLAARVLGDVARDEVATQLADVVRTGDMDLRLAAADSLARIGERIGRLPDAAVEQLLKVLSESNRNLRLAVVRALAASDGERTGPALTKCLRDDDSFVRTEAIRALARLGRTGAETERLIDDADPGVRLAAAQAVAAAGEGDAVALLADFAFAFEGYHRREAGRLLRALDRTRAGARFLDVLDDDERIRTWPVAIEALEELYRLDPPEDETIVHGRRETQERKIS